MKISTISDMHGDHAQIQIMQCDVLCICGDIVPLKIQRNLQKSAEWMINNFLPWCMEQPCDKVYIVGGNHDFVLDQQFYFGNVLKYTQFMNKVRRFEPKVVFLNNTEETFMGVKFWGSPYTTGPAGWANYRPDESNPYAAMPKDADVVLVHQPPCGGVGTVLQYGTWNYLTNYGSVSMMEQLLDPENKVKYLFCGHIHTGQHFEEQLGNTKCFNVSVKDENYDMVSPPLTIEI